MSFRRAVFLVGSFVLAASAVSIAAGVCTPSVAQYRAAVQARAVAIAKAIAADRKGFLAERRALSQTFGQMPKPAIELFGKQNGQALGIIAAESMRASIPPELLTAAMVQEGLDNVFVYGTVDSALDGFHDLGVDGFATDMAMLKRAGFLRKDYDGIRLFRPGQTGSGFVDPTGNPNRFPLTHWKNEAGQVYQGFQFRNLQAAAEAIAAYVRYKESLFLRDAKELGIDVARMPPQTRMAWAYLYYNAGEGRGKMLLRKSKNGAIPKYQRTKRQHAGLRNANRIMASIAQYTSRGLFPDPLLVGECAGSGRAVGSNVSRNAGTRGGEAAKTQSSGDGGGAMPAGVPH